MCGICGVYNYRADDPVDGSALETMKDLLAHRGPDEDGTHIDSQWWSLDNTFPMRSQSLIDARSFAVPSYVSEERVSTFQRWKDSGLNIAKRYVAECRRRDLEAFYSYRLSETLKDFANGRSGELLLARLHGVLRRAPRG